VDGTDFEVHLVPTERSDFPCAHTGIIGLPTVLVEAKGRLRHGGTEAFPPRAAWHHPPLEDKINTGLKFFTVRNFLEFAEFLIISRPSSIRSLLSVPV
jgi:hypothetical protein